jgi:hypothetical protein
MKTNESTTDRVLRVIFGLVLLALGFLVVPGGWGLFLKIFALVPLLTGIVGFCPLYSLFKFSTKKA